MSIALYDVTIPRFRQITSALVGVIDKAIGHCDTNGIDHATLLNARIHPDMLAFKDQIEMVAFVSVGALDAVEAGVFTSPALINAPFKTLQEARAALVDALAQLNAREPSRVNALEDKDVLFVIPQLDMKLPFTGFGFLSSFSLPNFYFHATTAYDILRQQGIAIGKGDFLGQMQLKI